MAGTTQTANDRDSAQQFPPAAALLGALAAALASWMAFGALHRPGANGVVTSPRSPEAVLIQQLQLVNADLNPAAAGALHATLGKVYQSQGQGTQALLHLEAARDLALSGGSREQVVAARVALGQARLLEGQTLEAAAELEVALDDMNPADAHEFLASLALGRAKHDLGHYREALSLIQRASKLATSVEERLAVYIGLGETHARNGDAEVSLEYTHEALESLRSLHAEGFSTSRRMGLALELNRRAGDFHLLVGEARTALAHFQEALRLRERAPSLQQTGPDLIQRGITAAEHAIATRGVTEHDGPASQPATSRAAVRGSPTRHASPVSPNEHGDVMEALVDNWGLGRPNAQIIMHDLATGALEASETTAQSQAPVEEYQADTVSKRKTRRLRRADDPPRPEDLRALVNDFIHETEVIQIKEADAAVVAALEAYEASGDKMAAASAHNLLGWIRRTEERYPEAARRHMQALALALQNGGPDTDLSEEAEAAYMGLSAVQITTPDAAALLQEAISVADAAGVTKGSPGRVWGERRLLANAGIPGTPESRAKAAAELAEEREGAEERLVEGTPQPNDLLEAQVKDLMDKWMFERATGLAMVLLERHTAKGDTTAAALAHNLLGDICSAQEQYRDAARNYMNALALALQAGGPDGAGSEAADAAYVGLGIMQTTVHYTEHPQEATALLQEAVAAADAAGVPRDNPDREWGELRLRHAAGAVAMPASASV